MSRRPLFHPLFVGCVLLTAAGACDSEVATPESSVGTRIRYLSDPSATNTLPDEASCVRIVVEQQLPAPDGSFPPDGELQPCAESSGREMFEDGTVGLVQPEVPAGRPVRLLVAAYADPSCAEPPLAIGQTPRFVLDRGEKRFVNAALYDLGVATELGGSPPPRFLHTATRLGDGRVLIAGGFTEAESVECDAGRPPGTRCYELVAASDAHLFDPARGAFFEVRGGGMLEARAGHTATVLASGRVLIAGGAARARLDLVPAGTDGGHLPVFTPLGEDGEVHAHRSFELFDPGENPEPMDNRRDGDPGRGGFTGRPGAPEDVGILGHPRFMHAAAVVPGRPDEVLLAGGMGAPSTPGSYERYDDDRRGGSGILAADDARLAFPRELPSAATIRDRIWIFGGRFARSNAELAEVWTPRPLPDGAIAPASETTQFPASPRQMGVDRPEYGLLRPTVTPITPIEDGEGAVALGWLGPQCEPGTREPMFPEAGGPELRSCPPPRARAQDIARGFTLDGDSGIARPQRLGIGERRLPPAFGDATPLEEGLVAVTGGVASFDWSVGGRELVVLEPLPNAVAVTQVLDRCREETCEFNEERIFPRLTAVGPGAVLVTGGMVIDDASDTIELAEGAEAFFLQRRDIRRPDPNARCVLSPLNGSMDGGRADAAPDAGSRNDSGSPLDAGPPSDGGTARDGGTMDDAGSGSPQDASLQDAGVAEGGSLDAG